MLIDALYKRKVLTPEQEGEICKKCQFCCRFDVFRLDVLDREHLEFQATRGHTLLINGIDIYILAACPCQHIDEKEGCKVYDNRPSICKTSRGGDEEDVLRRYCGWYEPVGEIERWNTYKKQHNFSP